MTAVEVRVASDTRCPRCAARLCLTASIGGKRTVALCPSCDSADPHAERLIGYFAAHGSVQPQDMSHVSELLGHWLGSLDGRDDPEPTLAAQVEAWWATRPKAQLAVDTSSPSAAAIRSQD
ncbi:hypothetical protein Rhe02_67030 [Rhizocola hellebori]|uniref:Uncharacterized protein n=1 Tax=Rhizocola hellebori TaxID=1392758 RepID=A0A8J3VK16_9ACTN|nr:DUF6300 family protein [Rhizocola hellebori]GIH08636.1 hypothetical protein Rhe02_67030 [Rhizocola hellebori]